MEKWRLFVLGLLLGSALTLSSCGDNGTGSDDDGDGGGGGGGSQDTAGVVWTPKALPNGVTGYDVVWGGGKFVAVGASGGAVSADGGTWTGTTGFSAKTVCYGNATYIAVNTEAYSGATWRSTDGVNWASSPLSYGGASWNLYYLYFRSGAGFTVYGGHYPGYTLLAESDQGLAWVVVDSLPQNSACKTIAADPSGTSGPILLKRDGIIVGPGYVDTLSPVTSALELNDVTYGSCWVIVADSGAVFTSANATDWTRRSTPVAGTAKHLRSVTWTGALFVAVGDYGTILTSPDGTTWAQRMSGVTYDLTGVAWSGSRLAAIGSGGILTSP